jgi:hypothetical protein
MFLHCFQGPTRNPVLGTIHEGSCDQIKKICAPHDGNDIANGVEDGECDQITEKENDGSLTWMSCRDEDPYPINNITLSCDKCITEQEDMIQHTEDQQP